MSDDDQFQELCLLYQTDDTEQVEDGRRIAAAVVCCFFVAEPMYIHLADTQSLFT